jgi:alginate O-acetyltransferase complex protein AlgI
MISFSSPVFLFVFLPPVVALYFLLPNRFRNAALLACSLAFYVWLDQFYAFVLVAIIAANYLFAILIRNSLAGNFKTRAKIFLAIAIIANLGLLGLFKYYNFAALFLNEIISLARFPFSIPLLAKLQIPVGISFITFMAIAYITDIYRGGTKASLNLFDISFYLSFFPKVSSGPLERYGTFISQAETRTFRLEQVASGIRRFVIGLGKKVLIADTVAVVADKIFLIPPDNLSSGVAWLGALCFTIQIYFDFSGYTDMAIGLGQVFGFKLMENFNYPYISTSIRDFWQRWHISLSTWLRDYLYVPLGGNRSGLTRTLINILIVFLLCGLWHGANWTFIAWGLWYGIFLVLERTAPGRILERTWKPARHVYALLVIMLGWVFFRSPSLTYAIGFIKSAFSLSNFFTLTPGIQADLNTGVLIALVAGIIGSTPLPGWISTRIREASAGLRPGWAENPFIIGYNVIILLLLAGIFFASTALIASESFKPFIYSQF